MMGLMEELDNGDKSAWPIIRRARDYGVSLTSDSGGLSRTKGAIGLCVPLGYQWETGGAHGYFGHFGHFS
jgi:hypothetical protein